MPLGLVLLEPVRSAEPPIISGTAAVSASSAVSDAARRRDAARGGGGPGDDPAQQRVPGAPLISSLPSGEPWDFSVPALLGAPKPIVVRQAISEGRSQDCASSSALATASGSCPSTRLAAQPAAAKRCT